MSDDIIARLENATEGSRDSWQDTPPPNCSCKNICLMPGGCIREAYKRFQARRALKARGAAG